MAAHVSSHILRVISKNHGSMDFKSLNHILRQSYTVDDGVLLKILSDTEKFVIAEGVEKSPGSVLSPTSLIVAKTPIRVCQKLLEACDQCECLHLCRYFVCGNCKYGNKCKNSHQLHSARNTILLTQMGLQHLEEEELFKLLLQNDPYLLPEVCPHYNKGNGEHGSCKFKTSCTNLHVCQHFLQDTCRFGAACKRAHTFDSSTKILAGRGFSQQNISVLHKIYKNKILITDPRVRAAPEKTVIASSTVKECPRKTSVNSVSDADRNEICLYFIRKGCSFKEKCIRVHCKLPYKWQFLDGYVATWKDLPNDEVIEKVYCDPANDGSAGLYPVDFHHMTCHGSPVRRLSTASSVAKPPYILLTTEWCWYWKNDKGGWTEYGQGEPSYVAAVTSQTLEKLYLNNDREVMFRSKKHQYKLDLTEMRQENLVHKSRREVRRRPRFVSAQDVTKRLGSEAPDTPTSSAVDIPAHWDKAAVPSYTYKLVPLPGDAAEYKEVEKLFQRTMLRSSIHSIKRIQNISLWKVFQWQKEQMKERKGGQDVEVRHLFHGTDQSIEGAICEQNFDWRVCGVHGTSYGKGSYFARDASYSDRYCKSATGRKSLFVAQVLVGEFTRGKGSYVRPPCKTSAKGDYDSCVDNETNPAIFVIFEKYQIYPEFLIEYS